MKSLNRTGTNVFDLLTEKYDAWYDSGDDIEKFLGKTGMRITRIRSTLLRKPDGPARIEDPVEGYRDTAGFLCIEAK
jgi:hypothetical protein